MQVVAFDLFGTVFDLSNVNRDDVRAYAKHIRQDKWSPLKLPSTWEYLPPFPDAVNGIRELRKHFFVVTCTNAPLSLQAHLSKNAGIDWDCMIPLEMNRVYKTNPKSYMTVCEVLDVQPSDITMITANKDFGDIEASRSLGMNALLIRGESDIQNIFELNEYLLKH